MTEPVFEIVKDWLLFDNRWGEPSVIRHKARKGRIRLESISAYFYDTHAEPRCTFVWLHGDPDPWQINLDVSSVLDGVFMGAQRPLRGDPLSTGEARR